MTSLMHFPLRTEPDEREPEPVEPAHDITDGVPEATGPASSPAPLVLLEGDRMTQRAQILAALAHAFRVARRRSRDLSEREGGIACGLLAGKPPSLREQHEYASARNWAPPGHDGGTFEGMGILYHWLAGRPGVAAGNSISAISSRPFRACVAAGIADALAIIALALTHHGLAALLTGLGAVLLAAAWAGAGWLLMRVMNANPPARTHDKEDS